MASSKKKWAKNKKDKRSPPVAGTDEKPCRQFKENGTCSYGDSCKFAHIRVNTSSSSSSPRSQETRDEGVPLEPIDAFFARYPTFSFQRNSSFWDQFRHLMRHMNWGGREHERKREAAKAQFQTAMVEQFNYAYGTDDKSLEAWQRLCRILGIGEPTTLKEARKLVQRTHVNLCDLTEHPVTGKKVKIFPSVHTLRQYTVGTGKIFPKNDAKSGGLLKKLLREIIHVSPGSQQLPLPMEQPRKPQLPIEQPREQSKQTNKKKKKKKQQQQQSQSQSQAKSALKRTDSGVHLGDLFLLNDLQYYYPDIQKSKASSTTVTPFIISR